MSHFIHRLHQTFLAKVNAASGANVTLSGFLRGRSSQLQLDLVWFEGVGLIPNRICLSDALPHRNIRHTEQSKDLTFLILL